MAPWYLVKCQARCACGLVYLQYLHAFSPAFTRLQQEATRHTRTAARERARALRERGYSNVKVVKLVPRKKGSA